MWFFFHICKNKISFRIFKGFSEFFFTFVLVISPKLLVLKMVELEKGNWPVDTEVSLFHAMRGHKPAGMC